MSARLSRLAVGVWLGAAAVVLAGCDSLPGKPKPGAH